MSRASLQKTPPPMGWVDSFSERHGFFTTSTSCHLTECRGRQKPPSRCVARLPERLFVSGLRALSSEGNSRLLSRLLVCHFRQEVQSERPPPHQDLN